MDTTDAMLTPLAGPRIAMARTLRGLLVLLTLVNFLGPGAAGVWLALHYYRVEVGFGVVFAVLAPFAWHWLAFRPAEALAAPAIRRGERAHPALVVIAALFAAGWQYCVIAAWTLGVFLFFEDRFGIGMPVPVLVWVYGAVMAPLAFMASKEIEANSGPVLSLGFALVAFAVIVSTYLHRVPISTTVHVLAVMTVVAAVLSAAFAGRAASRRTIITPPPEDEAALGRELHKALRR